MKKLALLIAVVLVLSFGLTACGGGAASGAASTGSTATSTSAPVASADGKQLVCQIGPNPETLDPALNSAVDGGNYILWNFDCLLNVDESGAIVAGQAEKWEQSEDGLTWTFTLRDGLKWSDGTPLTANDFVYSWKRVVAPETAAPYGETVMGMVKGYAEAAGAVVNEDPEATKKAVETATAAAKTDEEKEKAKEAKAYFPAEPDALAVSAPDDKTFVVELAQPCAFFDKLAAFATLSPVQQAAIEANGDAWATAPESYVGNGPLMVTEWVPSSHIIFSKNPNYWNADAVKLDSIKALLMEDANASYSAYQTGEAMMIKDVPTEEIPALTGNPEFYIEPLLGTYYISLQDQKEPFTDPKVRQALSLAIDRDYVAEVLMQGTYTAAGNFLGTGVTDYDGTPFMDNANGGKPYIDNTAFDANLEQAKKLMEEAGYPEGKGFPAITYSTNDAGYHKVVAEYLQQAWKELGITLDVAVVEWGSFTPLRRAGDFQISRNGWLFDYNDASNMLDLLYSTNGNNDGKYVSAEFDAAMDSARNEADAAKRSEYLHKAEDILMKDAACIPLAYYNDFYLQSAKITGGWHSPYGYWYYQFSDIAA